MKKINLLALGNSLSREEMRNIKGGAKDEEDERDEYGYCGCFSFYCAGITKGGHSICGTPRCCTP